MNAPEPYTPPDFLVSKQARQDMNAVYARRAGADPAGARHFIGELAAVFSNLVMLPHMGKAWIGNESVMIFPFQDHLIAYTLDAVHENIRIERVLSLPGVPPKKVKGVIS